MIGLSYVRAYSTPTRCTLIPLSSHLLLRPPAFSVSPSLVSDLGCSICAWWGLRSRVAKTWLTRGEKKKQEIGHDLAF